MSEPQYSNLQLVGHHAPEFSVETDESGHKFKVPLPGTYHFGVQLGGKFVEIAAVKAGNLVDESNRIALGASEPAPVQDKSSPEDMSALATRVAALEAAGKGEGQPEQPGEGQPPSEPAPQT
jgi:hypothetical protein